MPRKCVEIPGIGICFQREKAASCIMTCIGYGQEIFVSYIQCPDEFSSSTKLSIYLSQCRLPAMLFIFLAGTSCFTFALEGFTVRTPKRDSLVRLSPGIIDIFAPGYNSRASLGVPAAKICRALQFTNQANFDKIFRTSLLEMYKIHNFIRKNILSNFVSVELEQGERLGGEPFKSQV